MSDTEDLNDDLEDEVTDENPDAIFDELFEDEEDEVEAASDLDYDPERQSILDELNAEGAPTVKGPEAEPEEATDAQHEARIDLQDEYEPGHAEALEDRFAEQRRAAEVEAFNEFARAEMAKMAAQRAAATAPPPEARSVEPPNEIEALTSAQFDALVDWRTEHGDTPMPQKGISDDEIPALFARYQPQYGTDDEGEY